VSLFGYLLTQSFRQRFRAPGTPNISEPGCSKEILSLINLALDLSWLYLLLLSPVDFKHHRLNIKIVKMLLTTTQPLKSLWSLIEKWLIQLLAA
jgi:hypothetical protein